jgi:hypothetical protein
MYKNITLRVFPRRTAATPDDSWAFVGYPPFEAMRPPARDVRAVYVSVTFTWDLPAGHRLLSAWQAAYPDATVIMGGPATGDPGMCFEPNMFLRPGLTFTSRGCPHKCPWCLASQREGGLRLLPIQDGWDVLDNNLLACPPDHVDAVLAMLDRQPRAARFTGGLEASRLCEMPDVAARIARMRLDVVYLAYDAPARWATCERAIKLLLDAGGWQPGQARRKVGVYLLAGFDPDDTEAAVIGRASQVVAAGTTPFLMIYRPPTPTKDHRLEALKRSLRRWMRPSSIFLQEAK